MSKESNNNNIVTKRNLCNRPISVSSSPVREILTLNFIVGLNILRIKNACRCTTTSTRHVTKCVKWFVTAHVFIVN